MKLHPTLHQHEGEEIITEFLILSELNCIHWLSVAVTEHQRDPSFSSSLTNTTLINCCQVTFKNHVSIISVITLSKSWCLRCSVFIDTCNNFTFRGKMLNSIKAVWLRSWGFIARLNSWPFTLSQCIRDSSLRVLFLRFLICESLLISAGVFMRLYRKGHSCDVIANWFFSSPQFSKWQC